MIKLSLAQAKDRLSELIRKVEAGEEIVITRRHKPAARLLSEAEYQRLQRQSAVAGLRAMRDKFKEAGLSGRQLHEDGRRELEDRP